MPIEIKVTDEPIPERATRTAFWRQIGIENLAISKCLEITGIHGEEKAERYRNSATAYGKNHGRCYYSEIKVIEAPPGSGLHKTYSLKIWRKPDKDYKQRKKVPFVAGAPEISKK